MGRDGRKQRMKAKEKGEGKKRRKESDMGKGRKKAKEGRERRSLTSSPSISMLEVYLKGRNEGMKEWRNEGLKG